MLARSRLLKVLIVIGIALGCTAWFANRGDPLEVWIYGQSEDNDGTANAETLAVVDSFVSLAGRDGVTLPGQRQLILDEPFQVSVRFKLPRETKSPPILILSIIQDKSGGRKTIHQQANADSVLEADGGYSAVFNVSAVRRSGPYRLVIGGLNRNVRWRFPDEAVSVVSQK